MTLSDSLNYDYVFLGLGCGNGLMLLQLADEGMLANKRILVIEPELIVKNDRTFCFWMEPERVNSCFLSVLVENQWRKVNVGEKVQSLDSLRYYRISGRTLSEKVQSLLTRENARIIQIKYDGIPKTDGENAQLSILGEHLTASLVFDNRPPSYVEPNASETRLFQSFYGWEIKSDRPVFDADCFTMMDFNVQQEGATQFMYVLPFDEHRALVEITRFGEELLPSERAEQALLSYLTQHSICYSIEDKEKGVIPMFSHSILGNASSSAWINTGERAGMLKPSTGYSFERSLTFAKHVVEGIKVNSKPYLTKKTRFAYYDRLLLQILRDQPAKGALIFTQLFKQNAAINVFKFLDERSTLREDLRILKSLPFGLFVGAAIKDAVWRSPKILHGLTPMLLFSCLVFLLQALEQMPLVYGILGIGMLVLGIPHGALDHLHALKKPLGWNMLGYVFMYIGLGALILGVFSLSPWGGLLLFLGYSMWHFGEADFAHWRLGRSGMALLWGCYVLGSILGSHVHETVMILREMKVTFSFDLGAFDSFGMWWILFGGAFFIGWKRNRSMITSVLSLLILSALPLIPAFAVFFIFQHSLHGWKKLKELNSESEMQRWIKALPFTLGACLLFGVNAYFGSFSWGQVFIFLAALSFPHVVLMATLYRKSSIGA
jgi:lycopene beta-cyclase